MDLYCIKTVDSVYRVAKYLNFKTMKFDTYKSDLTNENYSNDVDFCIDLVDEMNEKFISDTFFNNPVSAKKCYIIKKRK